VAATAPSPPLHGSAAYESDAVAYVAVRAKISPKACVVGLAYLNVLAYKVLKYFSMTTDGKYIVSCLFCIKYK